MFYSFSSKKPLELVKLDNFNIHPSCTSMNGLIQLKSKLYLRFIETRGENVIQKQEKMKAHVTGTLLCFNPLIGIGIPPNPNIVPALQVKISPAISHPLLNTSENHRVRSNSPDINIRIQ